MLANAWRAAIRYQRVNRSLIVQNHDCYIDWPCGFGRGRDDNFWLVAPPLSTAVFPRDLGADLVAHLFRDWFVELGHAQFWPVVGIPDGVRLAGGFFRRFWNFGDAVAFRCQYESVMFTLHIGGSTV